MRKEYFLFALALVLLGAILLSGRVVAPKVSGPAIQSMSAPVDRPGRGVYENAKYGFEMSYPSRAVIGPVGADGKPDPRGDVFMMEVEDEIVELYIYEPVAAEAKLSSADFAKAAVSGADRFETLKGRTNFTVAYAKSGVAKFGERALAIDNGSAMFVKRPGYFLIAMLYGEVGRNPGKVEDVVLSLKFPD